jgi:hypothetical protein
VPATTTLFVLRAFLRERLWGASPATAQCSSPAMPNSSSRTLGPSSLTTGSRAGIYDILVSMQHEEELQPAHESPVGTGALLIAGTAIASGIVFLFTKTSCTGDGSFDPLGSSAQRSAYCRALNLPLSATDGSRLLLIVWFGLPMAIALLATTIAWRRDSTRPLFLALIACTVLVVVSFILMVTAANIHYIGSA